MNESEGSRALAAALAVDRELRRRLAYECRVSEQTTRNWETGTTPSACYRPTIKRLIGIDWEAFERPITHTHEAT